MEVFYQEKAVKPQGKQNIALDRRRMKSRMSFFLFFVVFIFLFSAQKIHAASLNFSPSTGSFTTVNNFTVSVMVNSNQPMNGAEGIIEFPSNKLEVVGISKKDTIFSLWVQEPSFSNSLPVGRVQFQVVKLNPGYAGNSGKVFDIIFRVKDAGTADLVFSSGSVLANDGKGTNIISSFGSGVYMLKEVGSNQTISAPAFGGGSTARALPWRPSIRHFIQSISGKDVLLNISDSGPKWSNSHYAKLVWDLPEDVSGVATLFDDKPDSDPGTKSEGPLEQKILPLVEEGKHYFHIRFINALGPGPVLHYPLYVDVTAPKFFSVEFVGNEVNYKGIYSTSNPKPRVNFFTDDILSSINRYEIKIGDEPWVNADELLGDGAYTLPKQKPDQVRQVIVRAYDEAGNYNDATAQLIVEPVIPPTIEFLPEFISLPSGTLVIEGTAAPLAYVEVVLKQTTPAVLSTKADGNGHWRIIYKDSLESGLCAIEAKQILNNGAESVYTSPQYIRVNTIWGGIVN